MQHRAQFWNLSGRFEFEIKQWAFPAFDGAARQDVMAMLVSENVFRTIAEYLETPFDLATMKNAPLL
ncbi:MAG TPA: hypothetical protein VFC28_03505 [Opitutaceae bacterium]|nr:hypothetical protein [Opitutaceae bacterium]